MSITQRRNSQRLASTLDALTSDLDFVATEVEAETDEAINPNKYWENATYVNPDERPTDEDAINCLGADDKEGCFNKAFEEAMKDDADEGEGGPSEVNGSILQGDPGVDQFESQSTYDTNDMLQLGPDYGVDFDGDEDLQDSIRDIPERSEKQARIKKLIARIENVANEFEATGRKALAYRLDIVCNNLQAKYLNK